jgi:hypothetical protein
MVTEILTLIVMFCTPPALVGGTDAARQLQHEKEACVAKVLNCIESHRRELGYLSILTGEKLGCLKK